jgi:hypothetical protein
VANRIIGLKTDFPAYKKMLLATKKDKINLQFADEIRIIPMESR